MKPPVGGQAVIEGVMMQNGDRIAVAVRRQSDGGIVVRPLPSRSRFKRLERIPFVRGTFRLYDMLSLGIRALDLSSKIAFPEDEQLSKGGTFLTFLAAIVLAIGVFVVLPLYLTNVAFVRGGEEAFKTKYLATGKKLDMGRSCLRFKHADNLATDVIAESINSMPVDEFLRKYEESRSGA